MKFPELLSRILLLPAILWLPACSSAPEKQATESVSVRQVTLLTVQPETVEDFYEASGSVRARNATVLSAKLPAYVRAIHVREGERVKSGQVLLNLESPELESQSQRADAGADEAQRAQAELDYSLQAAQAAIKAAEAQAKLAEDTFRRYTALLAKQSITRQEYDEAESRFLAAKAQLEQANQTLNALRTRTDQIGAKVRQAKSELSATRDYLAYLNLTAPYAGIIVRRHVDPGTLAAPGMPLLTIEETTSLQLEVTVPESLRWKILEGSPIRASVEAAGIRDASVVPEEITPAADVMSRSFAFKLSLPQNDHLRSGMFGRARFPVGKRVAFWVPVQSVVQQGQLEGVFVAGPDNRAQWRLVKTAQRAGEKIEILSGLREGDRVVQTQVPGLVAGDRLEVRS